MISQDFHERFSKLILIILEFENSIEIIKELLAEDPKFEAYTVFKRFDRENKNFVNDENIMQFLKHHHIICSTNEIKQLMSFYDSDLDGNLSYFEFCRMILTKRDSLLRKSILDRTSYVLQMKENLSYEIELSLVKLIETEFELIKNLNYCLNNLTLNNNFNIFDCFSILDENSLNSLSQKNIKNYTIRNGLHLSDKDIKTIFQRFDIDGDGKITFWEFKKILSVNNLMYTKKEIREQDLLASPTINVNPSPNKNNERFNNKSTKDDLKISMPNNKTMSRSVDQFKSTIGNFSKVNNFTSLEERAFQEFIKDLIDNESDIEQLKCQLAVKNDFTFQGVFRLIEPNNKTLTLSQNSLKYGIKLLELYPKDKEIGLIYQRYKDGKGLSFQSFCEMFSPHNKYYRNLITLRTNGLVLNPISEETKILITKLLKLLLETELKFEIWRNKLNKMNNFNIKDIFNKLDTNQRNYLIEEDLILYFRENAISYTKEKFDLIFKRINTNKNGRISYNEFTNEFFPKLFD